MSEVIREICAQGLPEQCDELCIAWQSFDGSASSIARVGMVIGRIHNMNQVFGAAIDFERKEHAFIHEDNS